MNGSDDILYQWDCYHFQNATSDKVYVLEMWQRTFGGSSLMWFITARYGRRGSILQSTMKSSLNDLETTLSLYHGFQGERKNKGYLAVAPDSVGVSSPSGKEPLWLSSLSPKSKAGIYASGITFWCEKCQKEIFPKAKYPAPAMEETVFEFGCHGTLARRSFTTEALKMYHHRIEKFPAQQINIFNLQGNTAGSSVYVGSDPDTAPQTSKPHLVNPHKPQVVNAMTGAEVMAKLTGKNPKETVNDPPPPKPGTMIPEPPGIYQVGKRKVKFADDE